MISVPNRLLLSSGNKLALSLLILVLTSACSFFQKAQEPGTASKPETTQPEKPETLEPIQGTRVYNPQTGLWEVAKETPTLKMDTIIWTNVPETTAPPITSEGLTIERPGTPRPATPGRAGAYGSEFLPSYNVSLLLPFLTDRFDAQAPSISNAISQWSLHYYAGVKMALSDLESEGVKLNLSVLDTKGSPETVSRLLTSNPDLSNAHLIIGPYRSENVRLVGDFAKQKNITFVSPYSGSANLSEKNPNYIQVSPTLKTHCEAIVRHARQYYRPEQIVLVGLDRPAVKSAFQYFEDENRRIAGTFYASPLQQYLISDNSADFGGIDVLPFVELQDTTVFIVPAWSPQDESFVISFLNKVESVKQPFNHIVIYGMPAWMWFERVDYALYESLHVHITSNVFIDPLEPEAGFFRRRYFEQYGTIPTTESYLGYDIMLYFGRMIHKHGTKFQYMLDREPAQYLHTRFDFDKVVTPTTTGAENLPVEQFENKYVNILLFQDYYFQLAK